MTRIEQIEAELKTATPGPWYARENDLIGGYCVMSVDAPLSEAHLSSLADFVREADAAFIAGAPAHIAVMLPIVKAALAYVEAKALCDKLGTADVACEELDAWRAEYDEAGDSYKNAQRALIAATDAFKEGRG